MASTTKDIYQTLKDKDNPDYIEGNGPFFCMWDDAWLGKGYYFWESFIENAHFWGNKCYPKGYVICQANYTDDENKCFNLIDNPKHLRMFQEAIDLLTEKGLYTQGITTVARVLTFFMDTQDIFKFDATRAYGVNSKGSHSQYSIRTVFVEGNKEIYLDSIPAIQICFYKKKNALNLSNYRIIYPAKYTSED